MRMADTHTDLMQRLGAEGEQALAALKEITALVAEDEDHGPALFALGLGPLLSHHLSSSSGGVVEAAAAAAAELAKNEECRAKLVDCHCLPPLASLVEREGGITDVSLCAMRAIANCCYDSDPHRSVLQQCGGVCSVVKFVSAAANQQPPSELVGRVAAGTVLNMVNDNEGLQHEAITCGVVGPLVALMQASNQNVALMAAKALNALRDTDAGQQAMVTGGAVPSLLSLAKSEDGDMSEVAIDLLSTLVDTQSSAQLQLHQSIGLAGLIADASHGPSQQYRQCAAKMVSLILSNDECLNNEAATGLTPLLSALAQWIGSEEPLIRMAGALAMGNIARSDERVGQLVSGGAVPLLVGLLQTDNIRELHAALGALKNMAIAKGYREHLASSGVVDGVVLAGGCPQPPVQYLLASIMRSLTADHETVAMQVANHSEAMALLAKLGRSDEEAVWSEAARTFASIVKSCHTRRKEACEHVSSVCGTDTIARLLGSRHVQLHNEALVALALTAATPGHREGVLAAKDLGPGLAAVLQTCPANEIKENAVTLLATLVPGALEQLGGEVIAAVQAAAQGEGALAAKAGALLQNQ